MFYDEYKRVCAEHGVSPSKAAVEMGLSKSMVTHWKQRGNMPTASVLQTICEYFDCDISEFFPTKKDPVNKDEVIEEIDRLFTSLPPEKQSQALEFLKFLSGSQGK